MAVERNDPRLASNFAELVDRERMQFFGVQSVPLIPGEKEPDHDSPLVEAEQQEQQIAQDVEQAGDDTPSARELDATPTDPELPPPDPDLPAQVNEPIQDPELDVEVAAPVQDAPLPVAADEPPQEPELPIPLPAEPLPADDSVYSGMAEGIGEQPTPLFEMPEVDVPPEDQFGFLETAIAQDEPGIESRQADDWQKSVYQARSQSNESLADQLADRVGPTIDRMREQAVFQTQQWFEDKLMDFNLRRER